MNTGQTVIVPGIHAEIVLSLIKKLKAYYVFPEVPDQICARLQKHLEDGEYADICEGDIFALALTLDMQEIAQDEHLWVRWHLEPLPDDADELRLNPAWQAERQLEARLDNYGFHRVERLPGNVGYLDVHYFHRSAWGGDTVTAAMGFLANTLALIIDLRSCTGGYPDMVARVISYLYGDEPVHLDSIYWRDDGVTQQYWTSPELPGPRFINQPVFVLTSKATFSGGEAFAYILQTRKRAVIIGEKTGGGAHPGASYRIDRYFEVFIPIGRSISPITGGNWEGIGVSPDVGVPEGQALDMAHQMAKQSILETLGEDLSGPDLELANEIRTTIMGFSSQA